MKTARRLLAAGTILAGSLSSTFALAQSAERVVVFGDSLSDGGYFTTVLPPALFAGGGGSFTTNPDPVAPEVFAAGIGQSVTTAYTAGGVPNGGFNYAIGGARITDPNPLTPGARFSITQQVDQFLASGRRFGANDVVYIQGGGNDLFNFGNGPFAGNLPLFLGSASVLADQVAEIKARGAGTVVTLNVQSAGNRFTQQFNAAYESALAARKVNALFFDTDALFNEIIFDATQNAGRTFGITNVTGRACGAVSSLFCGRGNLVTPDANLTYALADDVHPTGVVQRIQGQAIASLFNATDQIGALPGAAQALMRSHRDQGQAAWRSRAPLAAGGATSTNGDASDPVSAFMTVGGHFYDSDPSAAAGGLNENSFVTALGVDVPFSPGFSAGIFGSYSTGEGDFDNGGGGYDVQAYAATGYLRGQVAMTDTVAARFILDATIGRVEYDDLTRTDLS